MLLLIGKTYLYFVTILMKPYKTEYFKIYIYNENNLKGYHKIRKIIVPSNNNRQETVQSHSRKFISIMICGNAISDLLSPTAI